LIRYQSTSEFSEIVFSCRVAFSKRSWPYLIAVAIPWLIQSGQRHIRRLSLRAAWRRHESSFYRFFSRFKFRPQLFFRALLGLIVQTFGLKDLLLVVDDTLCPKWGRHIFGTASFFDHVRRPRPGYVWGHNWVVLAVVVRLFGVPVSLPFWVALYRSKKHCPKAEFRTRLEIVAEVLKTVQTWVSLPISLVADGAYNNASILKPLAAMKIPLVSRLRLDAVLRRDAPKRRAKKRGRKPRYGTPFPKLQKIARSNRGWERVWVHIYGKRVRLMIKSFEAWWPKAGVKIRVVITRDPKGKRKPCFLSSTDLTLGPVEIIERFSRRWSIEQLFSDAKLLMGLDSAEVRSPNSVLRQAIFTFALVTWVRIWAAKALARLPRKPTSFAGQLSELRGDLLGQTIFASIPGGKLSKRNSEDLARLAVA
jgi:hypothetical protein